MKKHGARVKWSWVCCVALAVASLVSALALAQTLGNGPGATSTGKAGISLEKRSTTKAGVAVGVPGRGALPVLLPEAVARALVDKRNASFPLCVSGTAASGIKISQPTGAANGSPLVSSSGSRVTYNVGTANKQSDRKQTASAPAPTCATGSLVDVQISITGGNTFASSALFGVIPILISTE